MAQIGNFNFNSDVQFCRHLVENVGVAAVPGSSFFSILVSDVIGFVFASLRRLKLLMPPPSGLESLFEDDRFFPGFGDYG